MIDWTKPITTKDGRKAEVLKVLTDNTAVVYWEFHGSRNVGIHSSNTDYLRNIPAPPKLVPYTFETFPNGCVWMRYKGDCNRFMITGVYSFGVYRSGVSVPWHTLLDACEISLDNCKTWQPGGKLENEN